MSTSDQGVDLNKERDSIQSVEAFDELETAEDGCLDNFGACKEGSEEIMELSTENFPATLESVEPYIGMDFKSIEDARKFYQIYGLRTGFTVRINHKRRSRTDQKIIGQEFVCSKEGPRAEKYACKKPGLLMTPDITRGGCNAMLLVSLRDGEKWVVTKFVKEHNHVLVTPNKVPLRRTDKKFLNEDEKDKEIRKLYNMLRSERQRWERRCAVYQGQLNVALKIIEEHAEHLSEKVQNVVKNIKDFEDAELKSRQRR